MSWLLLPALLLLPGGAVLLAFGPPRAGLELLWRAGAAGFLVAAWGGLVLAQISLFSVPALLSLLAAGSLPLLLLRRRHAGARLRDARRLPRPIAGPRVALALVALVAAAGALASRPGEHFAGGWDPGVYLSAGASIANRGGLITRDELLASLDDHERDALFPAVRTRGIKYPGFFVHDPAAGTVLPQFQPLYPVILAVVISLFGGRASLFVNPALALAGILLLYRFARAQRGRAHGLVAAAFLSLNVVQAWNSRFSTSEMTAQVLLLAGFVFLEDFLGEGDATAGALSGLAFGLAPMATVTTVLVVPFALAAVLARGPAAPRRPWPFVAALAASLGHFALWSALVAPEYLRSVSAFFPGYGRLIPLAAALVGVAALAWSVRGLARPIATRAARFAPPVLAAAFLLAICWFWAVRPLADHSAASRSLLNLSWFLTPWLLVPFTLGGAVLLARPARRGERAFVLAGLAMFFFFLHDPRMHPTYPFTLRRFTPLAIPAIAHVAALLVAGLLAARGAAARAGGAALLAAALALPLWRNRELVRQREYEGLGSFLAGLASELPREGIVLCEGRVAAYALEHFAGRRVVLLDRVDGGRVAGIEEFVSRRLAAGETVTLLTPAEIPWSETLAFEPLFSRHLTGSRVEQQLHGRPAEVRRFDLRYTACRVALPGAGAATDAFPARVDLGENALGLVGGFPVAVPLPGRGDDRGWGRWTSSAAELVVPWPAGADPVEVAVRAASGQRRRHPARLQVFLDGVRLGGEVVVPPEMTEVRFPPVAGAAGAPRRRRLRLESSTWNPDEEGIGGYPDGLGVLVDWVEIRRSQ